MPQVKACIWNIQNYGQFSEKYGPDNGLRNQFIARFARKYALDVILIQEAQMFCGVCLADLQRKLNAVFRDTAADWAYSFCGSTINSDAVNQAQNMFDVGYASGARSEGYAVLWRRTQFTRFIMLNALFPIATVTGPANAYLRSPLYLSQEGRPFGEIDGGKGRPRRGATGGYDPTDPDPYPWELDPDDGLYGQLDYWPDLYYPPTSNTDPSVVSWSGVRRPAYVVIKLSDGHDTLVPIAAYHAPSNQNRASWGAFVAGMARELYATNQINIANVPQNDRYQTVTKTIFGGDFNWSVNEPEWPGDYRYFTEDYSFRATGGAECLVQPESDDPDDERRSTVQIVTGDNHDVPINSANVGDYLRHKIDLVFYPIGSNIDATRVNLMDEVLNDPGGVYDDVLRNTAREMQAVVRWAQQHPNPFAPSRMTPTGPQDYRFVTRGGHMVQDWIAIISGAWGGTFINWDTTINQFWNRDILDARRAAEYAHIFVSDHFPLVATIDW